MLDFPVQFGLAGENDLQHFAAPGFEIPQQSDLFEHVPIEILRLIHNQNRRLIVGWRARSASLFSANSTSVFECARALQIEIVGDHFEELSGVSRELKRNAKGVWCAVRWSRRHSSIVVLPVPTSPGEHDEAFAALHAINKTRQRLFVLRAAVQKGRVRTEIERTVG